MKTLTVELGPRSYPIYIGENLFDKGLLAQHIRGSQVMIVSNTTVAPLYLERCKKSLQDFEVHQCILPDGEEYKNLKELEHIFTALLQARCDRQSTLIALGGGVVGDMTGYAAASYQRGVDFIQIPTTLLAQVDSSVGGKTGVNHPLGKNMIGAFHQPKCVLADTQTLDTLEDRQLYSGIAEVIKYGLICDAEFYSWLEKNMSSLCQRDAVVLAEAIERSCANKAKVVAEDELESGRRALLNLGHTFGHAMESFMHYKGYLHGEAVAAGMAMAAQLSAKLGWINSQEVSALENLLQQAHLPIRPPAGMGEADFMHLMSTDKKVSAGKIRLVLLKSIGDAVLSADYDADALKKTFAYYQGTA